MTFFSRRTALSSIAALGTLALVACGGADTSQETSGSATVASALGHAQGSADAPITMIEYASPTCPACRYFHKEVSPRIMEEYVDKGLVRFVYREYPLNEIDVAAYAMANCLGDDKFFDVLDDLFENQSGVQAAARNGVVKSTLVAIGQRHGLRDEAHFDECTSNADIRTKIADTFATAEEFGVTGTPTFIINGETKRFEGDFNKFQGFREHFDDILGVTAEAPAPQNSEEPIEIEERTVRPAQQGRAISDDAANSDRKPADPDNDG